MQSSLCFLAILTSASLCAQSPSIPLLVDSATATQHLISSPQPYLPPIAKAAHVFGDVKLQLSIDTSGRVSAMTILGGPEMLRASALDATRQWTYRPFSRDDQPANATTVVTLAFRQLTPSGSSGRTKISREFIEAEIECRQDIRSNAKPEKQLKSCSQAAARADAMQDSDPYGESRVDTYITAASLLLRNHQYEIARTYANKALALLERGFGDMAKPCAAYTTRAEAEWSLKEANAANLDLLTAEERERVAIEVIQDDSSKRSTRGF